MEVRFSALRISALVLAFAAWLCAPLVWADSLTNTGPMTTGRASHTATLLPNGLVLVAGGLKGEGGIATNTADLYDPASGTWSPTGPMSAARAEHTATLLPNGKVLVTGGISALPGGTPLTNVPPLATAELYDPALGTWSPAGTMSCARNFHQAVLLPNGTVLVAGGGTNSADIYDPETGAWTATNPMQFARLRFRATLLASGDVLVGGGYTSNITATSSCELYAPSNGTWSLAASMNYSRVDHTATVLSNGLVLIAGGQNSSAVTNAELYNPGTGVWSKTGAMRTPRYVHTATLLTNGYVLADGGLYGSEITGGGPVTNAELYNPVAGTWGLVATDTLDNVRFDHTATLLPNGLTLLAGGINHVVFNDLNSSLSNAELFALSPPMATTFALTRPAALAGGAFQFSFTNTPSVSFTVFSASNCALPFTNWTQAGTATEVSPGQYQFTDPQATNSVQMFYRVRSP